jgi:hypothetical protein
MVIIHVGVNYGFEDAAELSGMLVKRSSFGSNPALLIFSPRVRLFSINGWLWSR